MVSLGLTILPLVAVFLFPSPTLQSCQYDGEFATEMSKEGYSWCWEKYYYLYVGGFKRIQGGSDDLRNFKKVKCCRPPQIHRGKPYTCTSADWELSFKKWVALCKNVTLMSHMYSSSSPLVRHRAVTTLRHLSRSFATLPASPCKTHLSRLSFHSSPPCCVWPPCLSLPFWCPS